MAEAPLRLSPRADALIRAVTAGAFADPAQYRLQLLASRLTLIAGFDELICLEGLRFDPFDYQIRAAQTALRRFRGRGLLCDEVGLGKTIEAGLVLKEYLARGMAERVLILTPPGLLGQWREELRSKFGLPDFVTSADPEFRALGAAAWARFPRLIASLVTARLAKHRAAVADIVYDLLIVDEAHYLKNRGSVSWKFVNSLQKKYILLLTATPVQNNLEELYNLITILKPGQLKTPVQFRREFVAEGEDPRLPKNRGRLRELLADVMVRHSRGQVSIDLPPRRAHTIRVQLSPPERALYDEVSAFVRSLLASQTLSSQDQVEDEREALANDARASSTLRFTLGVLQREIGSSPAAAYATLRKLAESAGSPDPARLVRRRSRVLPRGRAKEVGAEPFPPANGIRRAAPGGAAAEQERFAGRRQELEAMADRALSVDCWAKAEALERVLPTLLADPQERVIVFTHFRQTLELLADRLRALGVDFGLYHGGLTTEEKDGAIARFERGTPVLLSTEAAGEGRNLQFCRVMVNFDLPWNPMRIEQRIGRIHRIGQRRQVEIYNLSAQGTIEDYILDILDRKINIFELVVGEVDMILGQLGDERDFEELVMEVWARSGDVAEVEMGMQRLGDALAEARGALQRSQELDEALFGEDFAADG